MRCWSCVQANETLHEGRAFTLRVPIGWQGWPKLVKQYTTIQHLAMLNRLSLNDPSRARLKTAIRSDATAFFKQIFSNHRTTNNVNTIVCVTDKKEQAFPQDDCWLAWTQRSAGFEAIRYVLVCKHGLVPQWPLCLAVSVCLSLCLSSAADWNSDGPSH